MISWLLISLYELNDVSGGLEAFNRILHINKLEQKNLWYVKWPYDSKWNVTMVKPKDFKTC